MENLLKIQPYALGKAEKQKILYPYYEQLHEYHMKNCKEYQSIVQAHGVDQIKSIEELPYLPVRLFKDFELCSVDRASIVKTVVSSGTSGQMPSKIFLDKETAGIQHKVLTKIVSDFIGSTRMPMIILDCPSVVRDKTKFTTRGAGILGFSIFGTEKIYALDDDMKLNLTIIKDFLEKHKGKKILLFGFTFIIWQHFYRELQKLDEQLDLSQAVMIHGGGWKKLVGESVSKEEFRNRFCDICKLSDIHENYGMAEQTGSIFMECEEGHLHVSNYSDVIIRHPFDFSPCEIGESGIMQVLSVIPKSYPGYSLLTEDEGVILGEDDCLCGRKGKYFKINGRLKNAEIRGCSDTYADKFK